MSIPTLDLIPVFEDMLELGFAWAEALLPIYAIPLAFVIGAGVVGMLVTAVIGIFRKGFK